VPTLGVQVGAKDDEIRLGQERRQGGEVLNPEKVFYLGLPLAVVVANPHIEGLAPLGYLGADSAHSHDPQRLVVDVDSGEIQVRTLFPFPLANKSFALDDPAGRGQQQGKTKVGRGLS
jgi:hypothetical protein